MLNTLLIINRLLPLVNYHYFLSNPSTVLTFYHHFSTDQWTARIIHLLKHSKKLILLLRSGKTCLWLTCLSFLIGSAFDIS